MRLKQSHATILDIYPMAVHGTPLGGAYAPEHVAVTMVNPLWQVLPVTAEHTQTKKALIFAG
jgi:hypothetical protein